MRTKPGHTYGTLAIGGKLVRVEVPNEGATRWACRRIEDFAPTPIPEDAGFDKCTSCGADIVFNPATPAALRSLPKVCLQCDGIEPLPFEDPPA